MVVIQKWSKFRKNQQTVSLIATRRRVIIFMDVVGREARARPVLSSGRHVAPGPEFCGNGHLMNVFFSQQNLTHLSDCPTYSVPVLFCAKKHRSGFRTNWCFSCANGSRGNLGSLPPAATGAAHIVAAWGRQKCEGTPSPDWHGHTSPYSQRDCK